MPIQYRCGDLLGVEKGLIAHGVNCAGGFGKGVAGQIAARYPVARDRYFEKRHGEGWRLGEVQVVNVSPVLKIANCATQLHYWKIGEPRGVFVDYTALERAMRVLSEFKNEEIFVPKIGAGLAGGDWPKIERIIATVFREKKITVLVQ